MTQHAGSFLAFALCLNCFAVGTCDEPAQPQFDRVPYTREASDFDHLLDTPAEKLDDNALNQLAGIVPYDAQAFAEWYGPNPNPTVGDLASYKLATAPLSASIRDKIVSKMTAEAITVAHFKRYVVAAGVDRLTDIQAAEVFHFCEMMGEDYDTVILDAIATIPGCIDGKFDPLIDRHIASRDPQRIVLAARAILKRCNKVSCWNNRIIDACSEPLPGHLAVTPDTRQPFDQRLILLRCLTHNGYPTRRLKEFVAASRTESDLEYSLLVHAINWQIFDDEQSLDAIMSTLNRGETRTAKEAAARTISRDILLPKRLSAELARLLDSTTGLVAAYVSIAVVRNFTLADFDGEQLNRMLNHRDPGVAQRLLDWHSEQSPAQSVPPPTESRNVNER